MNVPVPGVLASGRLPAGHWLGAWARIGVAVCMASLSLAGIGRAHSVSMQAIDEEAGRFRVVGRFVVPASREAAWQVLTDYNGLPRFVSSMVRSTADVHEGRLRVEQEAVARFLLFSRRMTVVLDVREDSLRTIHFTDVSGKDFVHYDGSWALTSESGGIEVVYRLEAQPRHSIPRILRRRVLHNTVGQLLAQVREEIERVARHRTVRGASEADPS